MDSGKECSDGKTDARLSVMAGTTSHARQGVLCRTPQAANCAGCKLWQAQCEPAMKVKPTEARAKTI